MFDLDLMSPELAATLAAVVTAGLGGLGWLIRRKLIKGPAQERTALYTSLAEMKLKLRQAGLSLEEVRKLEASLFVTGGAPSVETLQVVAGEGDDDDEKDLPRSYFTTARMRTRALTRLGTIDNRIEELVVGFEGLISDQHAVKVRAAYEAWGAWRLEEAEAAAAPFVEGTLHGLVRDLAMIRLGEDYVERLKGELKAAKELARR